MKFTIITPTYKRASLLERAVTSMMSQNVQDWNMIIVNDSPDDTSDRLFENTLKDVRIQYLKNDVNSGVNFSRNRALALAKEQNPSGYLVLLDDDDYFTPDALFRLSEIIAEHPNEDWIVTNRKSDTSETHGLKDKSHASYVWSYLIGRKLKGDATHCIKISALKDISFPHTVRQGDEWLFFYQLGLHTSMYYRDIATTLSDGYNEAAGLNFRKRGKKEQAKTLLRLIQEAYARGTFWHFSFIVYISLRFLRAIIR